MPQNNKLLGYVQFHIRKEPQNTQNNRLRFVLYNKVKAVEKLHF